MNFTLIIEKYFTRYKLELKRTQENEKKKIMVEAQNLFRLLIAQ